MYSYIKKTFRIILLTVSLFIVFILWLNSTLFFRFYLAKYYMRHSQKDKIVLLYKKIFRKELSKHVASNKILDLNKSNLLNEVYIWLSQFYLSRNDWPALIEEYNFWIKVFPGDSIAYTKLCLVYLKEGDLLNASKIALRFKKKFKRDIFSNLNTKDKWYISLGVPYSGNNLWQGAIKKWDNDALSYLEPGERYFEKALVYENLNMQDMATLEYLKTLELIPGHIDALYKLNDIYNRAGLLKESGILQLKITELTPVHKLECNLGNVIKFLGYDIKCMESGNTKFRFWFQCTAKIDIDYEIWVNGLVRDKKILDPDRIQYGYANLGSYSPEKPTTKWQKGEVYVFIFNRKINQGWYNFYFGFWQPQYHSPKRLMNFNIGRDEVNLGWTEIKY